MFTEQSYQDRMARLETAIALGTPDRVPFAPQAVDFVASNYGLSPYDMMKDIRNILPCLEQYLNQFQPDLVWPVFCYNLDACELLGANFIRLPGPTHGLSRDSGFQILDNTYLEDDEFDEYLADPTHVTLTKILPRKYKALEPLSKLNLRQLTDMKLLMDFGTLAQSDVKAAMETLMETARLTNLQAQRNGEVARFIRGRGFPSIGGTIFAPFDVYADSLRGLIQAVMDIKMYPDEVLAITNRIEQMTLEPFVAELKARNQRFAFIPLHAASDEFMSCDDYAEFYWPGLKRVITRLVDAGITPFVFCEGKYNTRLEFLKDVPKGKVVYMFEQVDIARAKKELEGVACICGNFPSTLLVTGTKQEVVDETKRLIDICAPGGGFIMNCSITLSACKQENYEAWYDTTMTYGKY